MGAILVPGVDHRLLPGKSITLLQPQVISVHTMVWDLVSCERYFRQAGNPYSHIGTGPLGEVRQWQDLRYRAASDLDGNPYNISIENADSGPGFPVWSGSDVPAFTDPQAESLVVILSWLCHRFGLPKSAIRSSCPHERGIGWHRLGVDPWRDAECGRRWSSARGKVCPGDRRIHQLTTEIIPAVSAPTPPEDDMTEPERQMLREVHAAVYSMLRGNFAAPDAPGDLSWLEAKLAPIRSVTDALRAAGTIKDIDALVARPGAEVDAAAVADRLAGTLADSLGAEVAARILDAAAARLAD